MQQHKPFFVILVVFICTLYTNICLAANSDSGKSAYNSSYPLSYEQIKMAAENGDADAQYALGYMLYYGKGGAIKDVVAAKQWIEKAATQKQPQAIRALTLINKQPSVESNTKRYNTYSEAQSESVHKQPVNNDKDENSVKIIHDNSERMNLQEKNPKSDTEKMTLVDMHHKNNKTEGLSNQQSNSNGLYTLQLLGASHKDPIIKFIQHNHLQNNVKVRHTLFNNKDWYILLYGEYKTKSEAALAANKLEKKLDLKPWVKPL